MAYRESQFINYRFRAIADDIDEDEIAASVVRAGGVETTTVSIDEGEDTVGGGEEEEDTAELPTEVRLSIVYWFFSHEKAIANVKSEVLDIMWEPWNS